MRFHRPLPIAVCVIGVALIIAYFFHSRHDAKTQRSAIAAFSTTVTLGMPRNEAVRLCEAACAEHRGWKQRSNVTITDGSSAAVVESPLRFGASNWIVWVLFDRDTVSAVLVRTEDTNRIKPETAPQDCVDDPSRPLLAGFASAN
jgi:hypothetical protein